MDVSHSSTLVVTESIVCRVSSWKSAWRAWLISFKSAIFELRHLDKYTELGLDHPRGGTIFSLRDGRDGHVATAARIGREESALPWRKLLIQGDLSRTSWQANRQMASPVLNCSNYWPSFYLSYSSVCVCRLPNTLHSTLHLMYVCVHILTWLIYKAELYHTEHAPWLLYEVLIKVTASVIKTTQSFTYFPTFYIQGELNLAICTTLLICATI